MTTLPGKIDFVRLLSSFQDSFVSYSFTKFVQSRDLVQSGKCCGIVFPHMPHKFYDCTYVFCAASRRIRAVKLKQCHWSFRPHRSSITSP